MVFFFFQAEDGIRDSSVTGVQTCALPISHGEGEKDGESNRAPGPVAQNPRWRPASHALMFNAKTQRGKDAKGDHETTGLQDYRTTGLQGYRTTGPQAGLWSCSPVVPCWAFALNALPVQRLVEGGGGGLRMA